MKPQTRFAGVALLGSFLAAAAFAANEVIQLRPLDIPVVTKWVAPEFMPAGYADKTIIVSMTLDVKGQPRDIKIVEPRDPRLEQCLIPALAQCRFSPAHNKAGVPVEAKIILPVKMPLFDEEPGSPTQIGALDVVMPRDPQAAPLQDRDNHPAVFHVNGIKLNGKVAVTDGATEVAVRDSLGSPEKISDNVWAYSNFTGMCDEADAHGCTTVLVAFANHRVAAIALVNNLAKARVADELEYFPGSIINRLQGMHQATTVALK